MSSLLIKNIGALVTGKMESPLRQADSIYVRDGVVDAIGSGLTNAADQTIDANGITAIPGLIDSHSHPSIGEYTPAQNSLSWITNYMHGGVTALISAGELHLPGLPLPPDARTALSVAIVTKKCYDNLRPSGVKVHAGTLLLVPGLTEKDFDEIGHGPAMGDGCVGTAVVNWPRGVPTRCWWHALAGRTSGGRGPGDREPVSGARGLPGRRSSPPGSHWRSGGSSGGAGRSAG